MLYRLKLVKKWRSKPVVAVESLPVSQLRFSAAINWLLCTFVVRTKLEYFIFIYYYSYLFILIYLLFIIVYLLLQGVLVITYNQHITYKRQHKPSHCRLFDQNFRNFAPHCRFIVNK